MKLEKEIYEVKERFFLCACLKNSVYHNSLAQYIIDKISACDFAVFKGPFVRTGYRNGKKYKIKKWTGKDKKEDLSLRFVEMNCYFLRIKLSYDPKNKNENLDPIRAIIKKSICIEEVLD